MNLVYAALLLHSAKKPITEESIRAVAQATGETPDPALVKALVVALEGVNIDEAIAKAAIPAAVPAAAPAAPPAEAKKPPAEEAKKEEEAVAGLGALFG